MNNIELDDYVVLKDTGEIGQVVEILNDPFQYRVRARGASSTYEPHDILGLTPAQVSVLGQALSGVAQIIDRYHDDEIYDPVRNADGVVEYSSPAGAVFRVLNFPTLIVELGNLSDRVAVLQKALMEAQAQR